MKKNFRFYWEEPLDKKDPSMKIDVPGFAKDEIRVRISKDSVSINAGKKHHQIEKGKDYYKEEGSAHEFSKYISLPHKINPEDFEASIKDGSVVLKKSRRKKKINSENLRS